MIQVEGTASGVDPDVEEFKKEAARFMEDYDRLTQALFSKEDVRLMLGGKFTPEGRDVALNVIRPVVRAHPGTVKKLKDDGTPVIRIPPTPDTWRTDGLVCLGFVAERLIAAGTETLFGLVNFSQPDHGRLLAWTAENVPELALIGGEGGDNGEEL